MSRVGQVWWARRHSITDEFEPCLILDTLPNSGPNGIWWVMHPLEHLGDATLALGAFESILIHVEKGGDDAWVKARIA